MGDYLTMNEKTKYDTIKAVVNERKTIERAQVELGLSRKQIKRLMDTYNDKGRKGFRHGNAKHPPSTTISPQVRKEVVRLYQNKYNDFNFTHYHEKLRAVEHIHISYGSLRNIMDAANILSPKGTRAKRREMRQRLKDKQYSARGLTKRETELLVEVETVDALKAHPSRSRKKYFGELIQMDASDHIWFGQARCHLHAAIDDATGKIVGAHFDIQETLNGYYEVTEQLITHYGVPYEIMTDKRTVFYYESESTKKDAPNEQSTFTQYGYACQTLGIKLTSTSIPQTKGRIERLFNTFQDRLINEMRLVHISTIEQANKFLVDYIPQYNQQFALEIQDTMNIFEKPLSVEKLNTILARFDYRVVDTGHAIKYHNKTYKLFGPQGRPIYLRPKTRVMVIDAKDGTLLVSYKEPLYQLEEVLLRETVSKEIDMTPVKKAPNVYIPPLSHPMKAASYQRYLQRLKKKKTGLTAN